MIFVGIDPGVSGAIARLHGDKLTVAPLPAVKIPTGRGTRRELDEDSMVRVLQQIGEADEPIRAAMEIPVLIPAKGVIATAAQWKLFGQLRGMLAALAIRSISVRAVDWQRAILGDVDKGETKRASLAEARRRWPAVFETIRETRHDLADAALIAAYAERLVGRAEVRR